MDGEDDFDDLVAAMSAEVFEESPSVPEPAAESSPTSLPSSPASDGTSETAKMLQRIKELEAALAREKGINSEKPPTAANSSSFTSPSPSHSPKPTTKPALTDLPYNIFTNKVSSAPIPAASGGTQPVKLTLSDIGLSETSSDEDEDFGHTLSKGGRELKRKLAQRAEDEQETSKKSKRFGYSDGGSLGNTSPFASFSVPLPTQAQRTGVLSERKSDSKRKVVEKCGLSGIRIANPFMSTEVVKNTAGDKRICKLSLLPSLRSQITNQTEWITIGVVVQKLPTKTAANGAPFSLWKLSDLEDTVHLTTLFLFSDAHKADCNIPVRTVIAIMNPSLMPKKEGKDDQLAISVNAPGRLLELGFSEDMGICRGQTKAGAACGNLVNTAKAEYCVYHLHGALQKMGSHRMELQSNFSGVQPKTSKVKEAANGYFYGGKMYTSPLSQKTSKMPAKDDDFTCSSAKKPLPLSKEAQALINEARITVKAKMTEQEQKALDALTAKNAQLNQLVVIDGPGARNLVRSASKQERDSKPVQFLTPSQLLKNHKAGMAKLLADQNKKVAGNTAELAKASYTANSLTSPVSSKPSAIRGKFPSALPTSATGCSSSPAMVCLDDDDFLLDKPATVTTPRNRPVPSLTKTSLPAKPSNSTPSQARALAKLKETGKSVKKTDPNRTSTGLSAVARERIERINSTRKQARGDDIVDLDANLKVTTKPQICNLQDDAELQALLNETSMHDDLCKLNDIDYMDAYFKRSAAKESLEEAIENTKEIECSVVTCKQCKYTASSLAERCFKEKHDHVKHKAVKRFFQCRKCSKRKPSFNAIMPSPCKNCGMQNFERCGMTAYDKKGPKLDTEILHIRGIEESKYLNSFD
ncbi:Protein MCM10-like protein [Hypsibius exemplaris]|uniref:Protein MCM10 homolog n=1 Tax=Hypsibius exemplaris TaxID=2072580 RepID=A0A1W0XC91_HYPEX|nr:Protein MCM10-like protein [Hypsibius exemplaris]